MARVKYERLKESDIQDDERYLGEERDVQRDYERESPICELGIECFFELLILSK